MSHIDDDSGLTIIWGIMVLIFLPDSPMRAKCWSDEKKTLILERLRVNEQGVQDRRFKYDQMWEGERLFYLVASPVWLFTTSSSPLPSCGPRCGAQARISRVLSRNYLFHLSSFVIPFLAPMSAASLTLNSTQYRLLSHITVCSTHIDSPSSHQRPRRLGLPPHATLLIYHRRGPSHLRQHHRQG